MEVFHQRWIVLVIVGGESHLTVRTRVRVHGEKAGKFAIADLEQCLPKITATEGNRAGLLIGEVPG